ncbi:MAG TPA: hypothetical protein VGV09_05240, partial [Steroidobacteraceae bacterium]|nr:hypothetical protein [Steroidobacteraceae bacterium]
LWVLPLLIIGGRQTWFAVSLGLCAFGCSVSNALLQVYRLPGKRDSFKTRGRSSPGKAFIEMASILAWMLLCAILTWIGLLIQHGTSLNGGIGRALSI